MKKKKIAILISGNIRLFKKNYYFLNNLFKDFEYEIFLCTWKNKKTSKKFKNLYKIKKEIKIKEKNWNNLIRLTKYVTGEENRSYKIINIFHMWYSIIKCIEFLKNSKKEFDYVCRFRTDLIAANTTKNFSTKLNKLKAEHILLPGNSHFRGACDQFFCFKFLDINKFKFFFKYLKSFLTNQKVLNPEYFFFYFLIKNKFKISLSKDLLIDILGKNKKSHKNLNIQPTKSVSFPLKEKINLRLAKYYMKILLLIEKIKIF